MLTVAAVVAFTAWAVKPHHDDDHDYNDDNDDNDNDYDDDNDDDDVFVIIPSHPAP